MRKRIKQIYFCITKDVHKMWEEDLDLRAGSFTVGIPQRFQAQPRQVMPSGMNIVSSSMTKAQNSAESDLSKASSWLAQVQKEEMLNLGTKTSVS